MTFDINAPLERQRTADGRKVLFLAYTKLNNPNPIVAFVEGNDVSYMHSSDGICLQVTSNK